VAHGNKGISKAEMKGKHGMATISKHSEKWPAIVAPARVAAYRATHNICAGGGAARMARTQAYALASRVAKKKA